MGTQIVRHRSRAVIEDLQFTANGETSWSFIAEGDGEIYAVESNNVASYTINGGAVSLPFSLINGDSYTVAITKTTAGQVADIQLKTRRADDKTNTINVPDLGAYVGDYIYALKDNDVLVKIDRTLFASTNYAGSGSWTTNPIVGSVTLPALSAGNWNGCHFGNGKIICIGSESEGDNIYNFCLVDYQTLAVEDLDGNADQYTTIVLGAYGSGVFAASYNYIRDQLIFGTSNGILILDLATKTLTPRGAGTAAFTIIGNSSQRKMPSFNPANETYALIGDLLEKQLEGYAINLKDTSIRGAAYNTLDGYTYLNDAGNRLKGYDANGKLKVARTVSSRGFRNVKYISGDRLVAWNYVSNRYLIFSQVSGYTEIDYSTIDGYETNMFLDDIAIGGETVVMKNNLTSLRLFVFDAASETYTGYLDLTGGANIEMICASQHI